MTTATQPAPITNNTPMTREAVVQLLRDAAFVLRMTRKVKADIVAERPEAAKTTKTRTPEMAAGLGV